MGALPHSRFRAQHFLNPTLWALIGSLVLAAIYGRAALFGLNNGVIGGHSDGYQNLWNNYWVKTALFDLQTNPFFTNHIYYPTGTSLRFHTLNPLNGILSMPGNLLLGYVPGMNLLFVAALALTALFSFLLIRDLVGNGWAAFVGAAIFTFANPRVVLFFNQGQSEKLSAEWLPLYLFFMWRALRPNPSSGITAFGITFAPATSAAAIITLLFASLTDWQYALYAVQVTLIYFLFVLFLRRSRKSKRAIFARLTVIGGGYALIAVPFLIAPMVAEAIESPWLSVSYQSQLHALDLFDFIGMGLGNPGYLALILGMVGILSALQTRLRSEQPPNPMSRDDGVPGTGDARNTRQRAHVVFWTLIAFFGFVLALGPELVVGGTPTGVPLPYSILQGLPVFNVGRDPGRYTTLSTLGIAVLAAFGVRALLYALTRHFPGYTSQADKAPWKHLGSKVVALLVTLTIVSVTIFPFASATGEAAPSPPSWPPFYQRLAQDKEKYAILELPAFTEDGRGESYYMALQSLHGKDRFSGRLARDRKLTNPNNFMKRAPLFRHFWLLNFPPERMAHYYPEFDFLTPTDYSTDGLPILNYYKVNYIVLYKEALTQSWDSEEFDRILARIIGQGILPEYDDSVMSVYAVPQGTNEGARVTIDVGDGWFASEVRGDGVHYRLANLSDALQPSLYSLNLSGSEVSTSLSFTIYAFKADRTVEIHHNGKVVDKLKVTPTPSRVKVDLTLQPGFNSISFLTTEPPLQTDNQDDPRLLSFGMYAVELDR